MTPTLPRGIYRESRVLLKQVLTQSLVRDHDWCWQAIPTAP
jgi:hypothetical protein